MLADVVGGTGTDRLTQCAQAGALARADTTDDLLDAEPLGSVEEPHGHVLDGEGDVVGDGRGGAGDPRRRLLHVLEQNVLADGVGEVDDLALVGQDSLLSEL